MATNDHHFRMISYRVPSQNTKLKKLTKTSLITDYWLKPLMKNDKPMCPWLLKGSSGNDSTSLSHIKNPKKLQLSHTQPIDRSEHTRALNSAKMSKVDLLKRKYWYEEPKPVSISSKYSMGAKNHFLGLSDAPRS
ncbi:uncharacterized protein LOC106877207 isoform X2 [Octopus bimaculoides]|uniref:Uncharacterized protein n=1 Tax=Octopus bimaculoides TaxID=37653 RepID=A0A0L8GFR8_OCTBM|nr:uncharacterized protein LOC106877207 isoform X2 [Octopus bimaculoides]XP_052824796.1 uncharacterized protein LOC106877207 isoform X2 [Octopus bimaculoides]|eukprot:XP_014781542.1 PREDICTED: uncharacterized protein LOC106877207 isoform X1 [Octopus bimaculoides]